MSASITAFEARTRLGELLDRVERGEEFVISRRDKAIARSVPEGRPRRHTVAAAGSSCGQRGRTAMSDPFVTDSSIGVAWATPTRSSAATDRLLEEVALGRSFLVPNLWFLEVTNTLPKLERNRRIPKGHYRKALAALGELSPRVDNLSPVNAFATLSQVAEKYGVSVYDAVLLELSLRREIPLATRDEPLIAAARRAGVEVLR